MKLTARKSVIGCSWLITSCMKKTKNKMNRLRRQNLKNGSREIARKNKNEKKQKTVSMPYNQALTSSSPNAAMTAYKNSSVARHTAYGKSPDFLR